jgi:aldehyde:ferredoxin oxidoreductase
MTRFSHIDQAGLSWRTGGTDFARILGQEMGGYATGEVFFISQALGLRHSHLDAGGYSYDQKQKGKDVGHAIEFLVQDEKARVFLTSMVSCLFARDVYKEAVLADCLSAVGYRNLAETASVTIPQRFKEVVTWKGPLDTNYMDSLQKTYAKKIREMAKLEESGSTQ